jgi:hypothetical protein
MPHPFSIMDVPIGNIGSPASNMLSSSPSAAPERFNSTSAPASGPIVRRELVSTTGDELANCPSGLIPNDVVDRS